MMFRQCKGQVLALLCWQVNTKPGARRAKKGGRKKKDEEHEDLDDDEQTQHEHEVEDAAGDHSASSVVKCLCNKQ